MGRAEIKEKVQEHFLLLQ